MFTQIPSESRGVPKKEWQVLVSDVPGLTEEWGWVYTDLQDVLTVFNVYVFVFDNDDAPIYFGLFIGHTLRTQFPSTC